jgi:hypothetical protein
LIDDLSALSPRLTDPNLRDYKVFVRDDGVALHTHVVVTTGDTGALDRTVLAVRRDGSSDQFETLDVGAELVAAGHAGNDFAEPWIDLASTNAEAWLSVTCGNANKVCLVPSADGGESWSFTETTELGNGALQTTHEPTVRCNQPDDCLAMWGDFLNPTQGDMRFARWDGTGWCEGILFAGATRVVPHSYLPAQAGVYELFVNDLDLIEKTAQTDLVVATVGPPCGLAAAEPVPVQAANARASRLDELGIFRHEGAALDVARGSASAARFVVVPDVTMADVHALITLRSEDGGATWETQRLDPPAGSSYVSPSLELDRIRGELLLFYLNVRGEVDFESSTYSVCYRVVDGSGTTAWPAEESCPVFELRGKTGTSGKAFGNNLFFGAVDDGRIALVYQDACTGAECSLFLARNY